MKKFFNKKEIAELLRVHEATINREIERGKLGVHRFGDRVLISETQLQSYLKLCRQNSKRRLQNDDEAEKANLMTFATVG